MSRELVSKATRNEFREVLVGFVLREIDMIFEAADLNPKLDHDPQVSGQRRTLVEQYYVNLDFGNRADIRKLCQVYEEVIDHLRGLPVINPEDVETTIEKLVRRMGRDGFRYENNRFVSEALNLAFVAAPFLVQLTEASIIEQVEKARYKIETGDHAGAITSAYTLVEGFLKELLRRTSTKFNENEGDIRSLYKLVAQPLNLEPKGDHLENYLKAILDGLQKQIGGLFEIANKASDRHARRYSPAPHHAKLAVNAAFTLCEFLLDSYEYQQNKDRKTPVS